MKLSLSKLISSEFIYIFTIVAAYFSPIIPLLIMLVVLTSVDMITGIFRSLKLCKEKGFFAKFKCIKSRKIRRTVIKSSLYLIFVMCLYLLAMSCFGHDLYLAQLAAAIFGLVELKSIAENMDIINETDIFTTVFKRIRKVFEGKINKAIESPE